VVSLPCWELFALQDDAYRDAVLPADVPTLSVEAASTFGWERYADASVGIDHFGASAPGEVVLREFGFDPVHIAARATELLTRGD
jgi:transketolase